MGEEQNVACANFRNSCFRDYAELRKNTTKKCSRGSVTVSFKHTTQVALTSVRSELKFISKVFADTQTLSAWTEMSRSYW